MIRVFILCSGLGNVQRGYETFTQECFNELSKEPSIDITLFKGGVESGNKEITLRNIPRSSYLARLFSKILGKEPYFIEQITFFLSLLPHIYRKKPGVIFFSDFALGTILWHWRRISGWSYKLLFSNGAPNGPPFSRMDHVQHLTPVHYHMALNAGEPENKHSLVPYGIDVRNHLDTLSRDEREALCRKLNLPIEKPLILSVGTINRTHKRMDYLIREVSDLPEPRPYLVMLGEKDEESADIVDLGNNLLGFENFQGKTVFRQEISDYYRIADVFVLPSLNEGFGRVLLEAMSYGLPCLVHDYEITRYVLGNNGYFNDFTKTGALSNLITQVISEKDFWFLKGILKSN